MVFAHMCIRLPFRRFRFGFLLVRGVTGVTSWRQAGGDADSGSVGGPHTENPDTVPQCPSRYAYAAAYGFSGYGVAQRLRHQCQAFF